MKYWQEWIYVHQVKSIDHDCSLPIHRTVIIFAARPRASTNFMTNFPCMADIKLSTLLTIIILLIPEHKGIDFRYVSLGGGGKRIHSRIISE